MSIESVLYDLSDSSPLVHLIEEESPVPVPGDSDRAGRGGRPAQRPRQDRRTTSRHSRGDVGGPARLNADIVAARITRYDGGVFYAELDLMTPRGREIFDCRTSDALILATRQGVRAPVLCAESVYRPFTRSALGRRSSPDYGLLNFTATISPPRRSRLFSSDIRSSRATIR